jgi:hypothetical protein
LLKRDDGEYNPSDHYERSNHAEIVPRHVNAGPSHGKNFNRTGKLERAQVIVGDHGDKMGTHGV